MICFLASAAPSLDGNCSSSIGVSTGPGLSTLVLTLRFLSSLVHVRANDRSPPLVALRKVVESLVLSRQAA